MLRRARLIVFSGVVTMLVLATGISAGAAPGEEMQSRKAEIAAAQERLMEIRTQQSVAEAKYEDALFQMNELNVKIAKAEENLGVAKEELAAAQEDLEDRASEVYKSGNVGFINVLVGVDNFSQFATRLDVWMRLLGEEKAQFEAVLEAKEDLEARKSALEAKRARRAEAVEEALVHKERAAAAEAEAEAYLNALNGDLQAAIQAEQEHQARLARAAAAEAAKEKAPEPVKEKAPEPDEEKAPEPVKVKVPEPVKEQAPKPVKEAPEPEVQPDLEALQAAAEAQAADERAAERRAELRAQLAAERAAAAERRAELRAERRAERQAAREAAEQAAIEAAAARQAAAEQRAAEAAAERRAELRAERRAERQAAREAAQRERRQEARQEERLAEYQAAQAAQEELEAATATATASAAPRATVAPAGGGGASGSGSAVVAEGQKYLGVPYRLGACDPTIAVDCSCFTMLVYQKFGIALPDNPGAQMGYGRPVSTPAPGDLLFWSEDGSGVITHVGIAMGDGTTIHASVYAGAVVQGTPISAIPGYVGARRLL